jgi:hypothetical protein
MLMSGMGRLLYHNKFACAMPLALSGLPRMLDPLNIRVGIRASVNHADFVDL